MAGGPYDAGFTRPDIGSGAAFIAAVLNQNKANERADQYANMEREAMVNSELRQSHEEKRKEEDEKHRRAVEAFAALPALQRMAMKSVGMANANPYGVKIEEQTAPPPSIGNVDIMKAAGNSYGLHAADVLANPPTPPQTPTLEPGQEGPEVSPELEAQRFAPSEQPPALGPEPPTGIEEAQSILAQPSKKTLFANVAGQRFELPQTSEHTPFGADYDSIYQGLLDAGEDPHKAMAVVAAEYKNDQAEKGRANRLADTLDQRNTAREDQQLFAEMMKKVYGNEPITIADRDRWAAMAARARAAAAGAGPTAPIVPDLIHLAEEGAPLSEIVATAGKTPQKQYLPAVQNVVKNAAAGERAGQRREALVATDDTGKNIGVWKDANAAKIGAKQIEAYHRVKERLAVLIDDIQKTGARTDLSIDEIQQRLSKAKSVVAALRPFNELSNTAAGQQMEEDIVGAIGSPGHGWLMGANLNIIQRLAAEAEGQHQAQLSTKLRPGGGSQLSPALGGRRVKANEPQSGGMSDDEAVAMARQRLAANPNDQVAKKVLQLHGLAQ